MIRMSQAPPAPLVHHSRKARSTRSTHDAPAFYLSIDELIQGVCAAHPDQRFTLRNGVQVIREPDLAKSLMKAGLF